MAGKNHQQDYEKFNEKVSQDVHRASFAAQGLEKRKNVTKVKINESTLPDVIPGHSTIEMETIQFHLLKFGDIVLVRDRNDFKLRRFIKYTIRGKNDIWLIVADSSRGEIEEYKDSALNGRITTVEFASQTWSPYDNDKGMKRLRDRWTQFGTSTPWQRLSNGLAFLGTIMRPQKAEVPESKPKVISRGPAKRH